MTASGLRFLAVAVADVSEARAPWACDPAAGGSSPCRPGGDDALPKGGATVLVFGVRAVRRAGSDAAVAGAALLNRRSRTRGSKLVASALLPLYFSAEMAQHSDKTGCVHCFSRSSIVASSLQSRATS